MRGNATDRLTIRISPELREALERAAVAESRSVSNYVIRAIETALAASGMPDAPPKKKAAAR